MVGDCGRYSIYLDCPGPGLFQAPCHGTRPHGGLRDKPPPPKKKITFLACLFIGELVTVLTNDPASPTILYHVCSVLQKLVN